VSAPRAVPWTLRCVDSGATYPGLDARWRSEHGGTLEVVHDLDRVRGRIELATFDRRLASKDPLDRSGVWRFRELILPVDPALPLTKPEGNTNLYRSPAVAAWVGLDQLALKHEGENPTGSFKDRGMTVGITVARMLGKTSVACASTGNTSASMAAYAAEAGMRAFVFVPDGRIAYGKLAQSLAYGARTVQIAGDFDRALELVEAVCARADVYLLNSINPFRIEGQKAIGFELLQDLDWRVPDWIALPGGNLGNSAALGKGMRELKALGLIERLPRIAVVQAAGASPLFDAFTRSRPLEAVRNPETIATAIRIGNPVSWKKSLAGVQESGGVVVRVTDQEILDAKAVVDAAGIGAEPASCATVAGLRQLVARGVVGRREAVCGILTGHVLKDPDVVVRYHQASLDGIAAARANPPVRVPAELDAVLDALAR
jgi:threonine synthase